MKPPGRKTPSELTHGFPFTCSGCSQCCPRALAPQLLPEPPSLLVQELTCSFLAREGQVVVAGDVVPFALLVPDHHNAVLTRGEEVIGLVGPPVLKLLGGEESPSPGAKPSLFSRYLSSPPLCLLPVIRRNHGLPDYFYHRGAQPVALFHERLGTSRGTPLPCPLALPRDSPASARRTSGNRSPRLCR